MGLRVWVSDKLPGDVMALLQGSPCKNQWHSLFSLQQPYTIWPHTLKLCSRIISSPKPSWDPILLLPSFSRKNPSHCPYHLGATETESTCLSSYPPCLDIDCILQTFADLNACDHQESELWGQTTWAVVIAPGLANCVVRGMLLKSLTRFPSQMMKMSLGTPHRTVCAN